MAWLTALITKEPWSNGYHLLGEWEWEIKSVHIKLLRRLISKQKQTRHCLQQHTCVNVSLSCVDIFANHMWSFYQQPKGGHIVEFVLGSGCNNSLWLTTDQRRWFVQSQFVACYLYSLHKSVIVASNTCEIWTPLWLSGAGKKYCTAMC